MAKKCAVCKKKISEIVCSQCKKEVCGDCYRIIGKMPFCDKCAEDAKLPVEKMNIFELFGRLSISILGLILIGSGLWFIVSLIQAPQFFSVWILLISIILILIGAWLLKKTLKNFLE